MSTLAARPGRAFSRVVVAVDERSASEGILGVACRLAGRLGARLTGLFVEDSALLRLAGTGAVREVGSFSGRERALARGELERAIELRAASLLESLTRAAEREGVPWSFRVARGRVDRELTTRCARGDLLVLGRGASRRRLGSAVRRIVETSSVPLLVLGLDQPAPTRRLLLMPGDGSEESEEAGAQARELDESLLVEVARSSGGTGAALEILVPAGGEALAERLRARLAEHGIAAQSRPLSSCEVDAFLAELAPGAGDLVVVGVRGALGRPEVRTRILGGTRGPVLFLV